MHAPHVGSHDKKHSHSGSRHAWRRLLLIFVGATLILGFSGHWYEDSLARQKQAPPHESLGTEQVLDDIVNYSYSAAELMALHAPGDAPANWVLELGKFTAMVTAGLLIFEVAHLILGEEWTTQRLARMRQHAIVCGLGRHGINAVRNLHSHGRRVVAIEKSPSPSDEEACDKLGVIVVTGDATDPAILEEARINHAELLYALCPDDKTNCEIAASARVLREKLGPGTPPLPCRVQVGDMETREAFQKLVNATGPSRAVAVRFFDSYDPDARRLVAEGLPIDHDGIKPGDKRQVHLVILGFGRMGRAVAVRAAQLGIFAEDQKLKISVIDREAELHGKALHFHHQFINDVCDITFHQMEVVSSEARRLLEAWFAQTDAITSVAICFDDEQLSLSMAVQIEPMLLGTEVRMAARMGRTTGLAQLINRENGPGINCQAFGGGEYSVEDDLWERLAQEIHRAYVDQRRSKAGDDPAQLAKLAEDNSMKPWEDLDEDLRDSNRQQAHHMPIKMRTVDLQIVAKEQPGDAISQFSMDQMDILAEIEHRRWVAERQMANWSRQRKKDVKKRATPHIQPWSELTDEVKAYDYRAVEQIPRRLDKVGLKVCRK